MTFGSSKRMAAPYEVTRVNIPLARATVASFLRTKIVGAAAREISDMRHKGAQIFRAASISRSTCCFDLRGGEPPIALNFRYCDPCCSEVQNLGDAAALDLSTQVAISGSDSHNFRAWLSMRPINKAVVGASLSPISSWIFARYGRPSRS